MAGVPFSVVTGEIATGTALKTLLQILAGTPRVVIKSITIGFAGITTTDLPIFVEILTQSTAGSGSSSVTPAKLNANDDETLGVTAIKGPTSEPTAGTVLFSRNIHPQGRETFFFNHLAGGGLHVKGATRLGLRVTAGVDVNATVELLGEE
jgi:hypothetical protein